MSLFMLLDSFFNKIHFPPGLPADKHLLNLAVYLLPILIYSFTFLLRLHL
jgi:hypothetical protein